MADYDLGIILVCPASDTWPPYHDGNTDIITFGICASTESTLSSSLLLPGFSVLCLLLMTCQYRHAGPPVCLPFLPKAPCFSVLLPVKRKGRGLASVVSDG